MNRMLLAALALACVSLPAIAAGEVGTVGDTAVGFPWGAYLVAIVKPLKEVLVLILTGLATALVARLGPMARMLISEALIDATIRKWLDYGLAATAGAVKGKSVSFDVGSTVVAKTLNRAQDRAAVSSVSRWALDKAGGPQELANKVIRMLPIEEGVPGAAMARSGLAKASDDIARWGTTANAPHARPLHRRRHAHAPRLVRCLDAVRVPRGESRC